MADFDLDHVTEKYYDILKELGNIGAGNATTALSQMLQCRLDMKVPQVKLLEFTRLGELIGGEDQVVIGVYLLVEGDISGSMMFLMSDAASRHFIEKLMGMAKPEDEAFNEMDVSALKEIGNIITGAYLNSLSDLTRLKILPSPPEISIDMLGAILSVPAIEFGIQGDKILFIQTQFTDDVKLDGYFVLVPDIGSYDKIMSALGVI